MIFTPKQIQQIEKKGLTVAKVEQQLELFKTGLPTINLKSVATVGDGIASFSVEQEQHFINYYEQNKDSKNILKFVPASGAATRMFKFLFKFLKEYNVKSESINSYINKHKATELSLFFVGLEKLPFHNFVLKATQKFFPNYNSLSDNEKKVAYVRTILDEDKLNYSFYPKGLLPFHKYKDHVVTAFEEHLFEAALYASSKGNAKLHFTISEKHNHIFDEEFKRIEEIVERKTNTKFDISFSYQKESTDTIAVTTKNEPFISPEKNLHFRPSGHGALLANLNDFDADVVFVKNIDNVVVFKYEEEVSRYKKMLAGLLLETQDEAFKYLKELEDESHSETYLFEIAQFLRDKLNVVVSEEFEKYSKKYQIEYLRDKLNRPIRMCGMVKNEGEPGGGPFWVKDESGSETLQIVESAQIDKKNKHQKEILKNATHFNPVDLVCAIKNYKGEKFDLLKYVDSKTAFITMKTKTGKDIKALELPGLWNGSMAHWNTIFVEVPLITFNPVKTVTDLLKSKHQVS